MKTFEFTDEQRHELIEIFVHGTIQELLSRIEQIVSERITPEQDTIKPYHEHGNSVASDRTESGQSAEDVLKGLLNRGMYEFSYSANECLQAMHTYASQVCADKEADLQDMTAMRESAMRTVKNLADRIEPLQNEIDRLNESMTVMLNRNTELEDEVSMLKSQMLSKDIIPLPKHIFKTK